MATELAKAYVQIVPTTKGIKSNLEKELGGNAGAVGKSAGSKIGAAMKTALIAAGIGKALKAAVSEGMELEQNLGGTEAVFGEFAKTIQTQAQTAYKNMGVSASEYMATANKMGSLFQGAGLEQEKALNLTADAMQRAADVASVMGIDMSMAMESIAGAAKGNFTMMDNLGVAMNATTIQAYALEKGINFDWNTADNAKKAEVAMKMFFERTEQYAGNFAKESEQTLAGSMGAVKSAFQNVLGDLALGNDIQPSLNALTSTVVTFITQNLLPTLANVLKALPTTLTSAITSMLPAILDAMLDIGGGVSDSLPTMLTQIIKTITDFFADNFSVIFDAGLELLFAIIKAIPDVANTLITQMGKITGSIISALLKATPQILKSSGEALMAIVKAFPEAMIRVTGAALQIGVALVQGIWNGISSVTNWVLDKIRGFGNSILNGIKNIFGIHSPSTEMAWIGEMLDRGLAAGIEDNVRPISKAIDDVTKMTTGAFDTEMGVKSTLAISANGQSAGGTDLLTAVIQELSDKLDNLQVVLDGDKVVGGIRTRMNSALGETSNLAARGVAV